MTGAPPLVLLFGAWPATDRSLWNAATKPAGLFEEGGDFGHLSDGSLQLYMQGYGQWLSYLTRHEPSGLEEPPVERVTKSRISGFMDEAFGRGLKARSVASLLMSILKVNQAFGGGWPPWLHRAQQRIHRASHANALKKPLPVAADQLFAWSLAQLAKLEAEPLSDPVQHAVAWRQALMVGIQISCPVRLRAMVAMSVDTHIAWTNEHVLLRWSAVDMKDKKARDMPLPEALVDPLRAYLWRWRPVLLQGHPETSALWISRDGNALSADSYQSGLARLTKREFGVTLRPHAFRHIAATTIAEKNAAEAGIIRDVLGHATIRTSEIYYNRAGMRQATTRLQEVVDAVRKSGRLKKDRKRRLELPAGPLTAPDPDLDEA